MKTLNKTAIIIGATGLTGSILLQKLLNDDRYSSLKIFSRKSTGIKHSKLNETVCNLLEIEKLSDIFIADEVYCCIGTTSNKTPNKELYKDIDYGIPVSIANICKKNSIETLTIISALGANSSSSIFYNKTKGEMEEAVLDQNIRNTYILRPSMISGKRKENRFGEKIGSAFLKFIQVFLVGSLRKYRIINADTIANAMINISNNDYSKKIISSDYIEKLGQ
jgi:uncharacterized protein YbjT (DUF2867 family)